jgi:hypothetical protein
MLLPSLRWTPLFRNSWRTHICGWQCPIDSLSIAFLIIITLIKQWHIQIYVIFWFSFHGLWMFWIRFVIICKLFIDVLGNWSFFEKRVHLLNTFNCLILGMIWHKCALLNFSELPFFIVHHLCFLFNKGLSVQTSEKLLLFARVIFQIGDALFLQSFKCWRFNFIKSLLLSACWLPCFYWWSIMPYCQANWSMGRNIATSEDLSDISTVVTEV